MDMHFNVGDELFVELEDECFIGVCHFISKDRSRIVLKNVIDFTTNIPVSGLQHFYKPDIKDIKVVNNQINKNANLSFPCSVSSGSEEQNSDSSSVPEENEKLKRKFTDLKINDDSLLSSPKSSFKEQIRREFLFNSDKLKEIEKIANEAVILYQTDRNYYDAIKNLKQQHEIALLVEPCDMGRHDTPSLIAIYTNSKIYIFDIVYLGKIFPDLRSVLESDKPRKIVYNSSKVMDNLKHNHDIELKGVFDTLVAYVAHTGNRQMFTFKQCASLCFNLPERFILSTEEVNWRRRPFDDERKILISRKVLLLHDLYQYLLHGCLLGNFYAECSMFGKSYCNDPDPVAAAINIAKEKNESIRKVKEFDVKVWP